MKMNLGKMRIQDKFEGKSEGNFSKPKEKDANEEIDEMLGEDDF